MGDKASFNSPANIHTKELRTNNSEDSYKNGRYLINIGKINDAIGPLKNFINIHPTNWSALYLLGYIYIKEAENNKSYYNYSIFYFDKAINTNKSEKKTWYYKGLAYYELGEYNKSNYNESINALNQALKIDENYTDALYYKGLVYFEMGKENKSNYNISIDAFDKALKINGEKYNRAWFEEGHVYSEMGMYDKSVESYEKYISYKPEKTAEAWFNKGHALYHLGRFDEAASAYDNAIKYKQAANDSDQNPNLISDAWYNIGNALYHQKDKLESSCSAYNNSTNIDNMNENAFYNKANVLCLLGKYDESIIAYERVIELNPSSVDAWNNKGVALFENGEYNESILAFNNAIKINPKYEDARINIGRVQFKQKEYIESLGSFNALIDINRSNKDAWFGKVNSLNLLNRTAEASIAYAIVMDMESPLISKISIFTIFLLLFLIFFFLVIRILSTEPAITTGGLSLTINLLGILACSWFFFSLYDFQSSQLVLAFSSMICMITIFCWASLGHPIGRIRMKLLETFSRSDRNSGEFTKYKKIICYFSALLYLIFCGIFSLRIFGSESELLLSLEISVLLIFIINIVLVLPRLVKMLLSIEIDHDTRNVLLILQFSYLCLNAILLSAVLWIFGVCTNVLSISYHLLAIMVFLTVLFFFFPYFSGWQRERMWRELLLAKRKSWINDLLDIFELPNPAQYSPKLKSLSVRISGCINHQKADDPDCGVNREKLYNDAVRQNDPDESYQRFLNTINQNISECVIQFDAISDDAKLIELGRAYGEFYRQRLAAISDKMEKERNRKPLLWIALTFALTSITTTVLALIGAKLGPALIDMAPKLVENSLSVTH